MNPSSNQILRPYNNQITSSSSTVTSSGSVQSSGSSNTSETFNTATLCKFGAETVQGIVSRTIEIFKELKSIQLPNGTTAGTQLSLDKKKKVLENFNEIRQLFIKLKFIYDKVNNDCNGMDYTPIETLIPYKDDVDTRPDLKKVSENYRHLSETGRELKEQLQLRSTYLKDIINQLRKIIWEINTMLAMRSQLSVEEKL
ncbi:Mediator of RNA polymerase II transcription subunit 30 [Armadillidium nasatum]|uniref:Mediator of RNA polymerase II transcription subunit 30 n=1 Tax=Armadillidium nasatum TaxID=96803 RepID=A0A5N5TC22_9CRUS|nr:Mediator of RNA polymerase II transcription subunit 30 [Armadillidium nasatum]